MPPRLLTPLLVLVFVCGAAAACGDDDGGSTGPTETSAADADAGEAPAAAEGTSSGELCFGVTRADLDALVPELEPQAPTVVALAEETCEWSADAGDGSWLLQMQVYEGNQFYGAEFMDDITELDICDRAFLTDLMGPTIQFQGDDTVVQVGFSSILVPADESLSDEEVAARLETFTRTVADRVC